MNRLPPSAPAPDADHSWAALIVSSRESEQTLLASVRALLEGSTRPCAVDLVINGNPQLAAQVQAALPALAPRVQAAVQIRVWHIQWGDKANALNAYIHHIWPGAACTFFIDGYVRVRSASMARLDAALAANPERLAATGIPSQGLSAHKVARTLREHGGLHGNFHALSGKAMRGFREAGFRLPVGLYRTDSTVGAALSFGLDPGVHTWLPERFLCAVEDASWDVLRAAPRWHLSSLRQQFRRRQRQAQGDLENWAVRYWYLIRQRPIGSLPATLPELIEQWTAEDPQGSADRLWAAPLRQRALRALRAQVGTHPQPGAAALQPSLLGQHRFGPSQP